MSSTILWMHNLFLYAGLPLGLELQYSAWKGNIKVYCRGYSATSHYCALKIIMTHILGISYSLMNKPADLRASLQLISICGCVGCKRTLPGSVLVKYHTVILIEGYWLFSFQNMCNFLLMYPVLFLLLSEYIIRMVM